MLAALVLCAGLAKAQVQSVKPPELAPAAALPVQSFALPALPTLTIPAAVAAQPVEAFAPAPAGRRILESLASRLRAAANAHISPAAVLDGFWRGPIEAPAGAPETVAERLNRILAVAETAPTGRMVLARARKLGKTRPVSFADLGRDLGRYDYLADTLTLDKRFLSGEPRQAAVTLVHELIHILQHAEGLPAEALELELEAHALSLKMLAELDVSEKARDGFSKEALKRLRRSPGAFVKFMRQQLPGKFYLEGGNFSELADGQEDELDRQEEKADRLKNPAKAERARKIAGWIKRDIQLLRSKAGKKRYLDFSRRVAALLERLSRSL